MTWKFQKYALITFAIILSAGLFFLFCVALGGSLSLEQFSALVIPILSMVGTWVSSIAAVVAVLVALWLAEQQRIRESENVEVKFCTAITEFTPNGNYCVTVVSKGARPSLVSSISLIVDNKQNAVYFVTNLERFGHQLPMSLSYGQSASFFLKEEFAQEVKKYVAEYGAEKSKLQLRVNSTTSSYCIDVTGKVF
ncbi:hypothetical protein ACEQ8A_000403 [Vibrio fluvialis]|nr:hypothetical protein [Vibrio fluvialis]ELX9690744.1 hypothetical protein [Vibrio fluvialis]